MKTALIILGAIVGFFVLIGVLSLGSYVKWHDYANKIEVTLTTSLDNQKAIRSEHYNKVQELVQVPAMYAADLAKVFNGAIEGRYGKDGSKAVFQFLKESNPNLDPDMYKQIMRVMEAGRNQFANEQTRTLDIKATYSTAIGNVWSGFWIRLAGYPKIDLNTIKPISTEKANTETETHISTPLQLTPQ